MIRLQSSRKTRTRGFTQAVTLGIVLLSSCLAVTSSAHAAPVYLDSYAAATTGFAGPVGTTALPAGQLFVAEVRGTLSYYSGLDTAPKAPNIICGTPDSAPIFPSPGRPLGPVGFDSAWVFSRPWTPDECAQGHLPIAWENFQINNGVGWAHQPPVGGLGTGPNAAHLYPYALIGHGVPAAFRFLDAYTADNYGMVQITARPATTSDCAGAGWMSFGEPSPQACAAAVQTTKAACQASGGCNNILPAGQGSTAGDIVPLSAGPGITQSAPTVCRSKRTLEVHFPKSRKGIKITLASLHLNGKALKLTRRHGRVTGFVSLEQLPTTTAYLTVEWTRTVGRRHPIRYHLTRVLHPCSRA